MSSENLSTRHRILDASRTLLESRNTKLTRMSDIAKAAGISRQALYLHFPSRADLLIATARHLDEVFDVDARLEESRAATSGLERLDAFVTAWGNHIPNIYGVGSALLSMMPQDADATAAWNDRMVAVREGCHAVAGALAADGLLAAHLNGKTATDLLWTLLSVRNWEQLVTECSWSQDAYIDEMKRAGRALLTA